MAPASPAAPIVLRPLDEVTATLTSSIDPNLVAADQRFSKLTAEQLITEVMLRRSHISTSFYAMGLLLRELARADRFLHELGFETFEDLLEQRFLTNRMTALKLITVATIYDERVATALGVEKGYALVQYAKLSSRAQDAARLYADNEKIKGKRVRDMSFRDLVRARRELKAEMSSPRPPSEEEATAHGAARAFQAWLRKSGAKKAHARAQRREGLWTVTIHVTPQAALACAGVT